jgi:hypothetical protein
MAGESPLVPEPDTHGFRAGDGLALTRLRCRLSDCNLQAESLHDNALIARGHSEPPGHPKPFPRLCVIVSIPNRPSPD